MLLVRTCPLHSVPAAANGQDLPHPKDVKHLHTTAGSGGSKQAASPKHHHCCNTATAGTLWEPTAEEVSARQNVVVFQLQRMGMRLTHRSRSSVPEWGTRLKSRQRFLKVLLTSLQGKEEVPVPLQLLHELLVLQEERNPLVLQVLLPPPLLLQGALAPWHRLPASRGALCKRKHGQKDWSMATAQSCWTPTPGRARGTPLRGSRAPDVGISSFSDQHRVEARRESEGERSCSQHHCFNFAQLKGKDCNFLLAVHQCSRSLSPSPAPTASIHVEEQSHTAQDQSLPCLQYLSTISTAALKVP